MRSVHALARLFGWMVLVAMLGACDAESGGERTGRDTASSDDTAAADTVGDDAAGKDVPGPQGDTTNPPADTTDPSDTTTPPADTTDSTNPPVDTVTPPDTTDTTTPPADTTDTTTPPTDVTLPPGEGDCPGSQQCSDTGDGYLLCMDGGATIPSSNPTGCHASDTGCAGNYVCLYTNTQKTASACVQNCGECAGGTTCSDVTGDGYLGCLDGGDIPANAPTQCHTGAGCTGNATCFYTSADYSTSVCVANCSGCTSDAQCGAGNVCVDGLCEKAPCTSDAACTNGDVCLNGTCVPDIGNGPGPGPGSSCPGLPPAACTGTTAYCSELIVFDPRQGTGYDDYPLNGETTSNQYRSYLRRDVVMALKHVAAKVACKTADWPFGNGGPIGLGDMSEANGAIPGTSINEPGHPEGTHTGGVDIDLGYFQVNTADNKLRPICDHYEGGAEAYHCTATPHLLDPWRTALFMGFLFELPQLRVIGCDGKAGPMIMAAFQTLCDDGWLSTAACSASNMALTYEETDQGWGWFYFHHHHFHVSFNAATYGAPLPAGVTPPKSDCLVPGCVDQPLVDFLKRVGVPTRVRVPVPAIR